MVIKRVGPLSCARIVGVLDAIVGLFVGAGLSLFAMIGGLSSGSEGAAIGAFIGVGAVIILSPGRSDCGSPWRSLDAKDARIRSRAPQQSPGRRSRRSPLRLNHHRPERRLREQPQPRGSVTEHALQTLVSLPILPAASCGTAGPLTLLRP